MVDLVKNKKLVSRKQGLSVKEQFKQISDKDDTLLFPDQCCELNLSDDKEESIKTSVFNKILWRKSAKKPKLTEPMTVPSVSKEKISTDSIKEEQMVSDIKLKPKHAPGIFSNFIKKKISEDSSAISDMQQGVDAITDVSVNEEIKKADEPELKEHFHIDLTPRLIKLPDIKDKTKINIRYPLIPPYAYAHIFWDNSSKELMYKVEEPELTKQEHELLKLVKVGLEEMINVSFAKLTKINLIIEYLEKNVQAILIELGVKITKQTYQNIMYYAYRDSVGFNLIEPMLKDYYIEDIECNGVGFPIYIVHRKYENLRTSIQYDNSDELADFIEKLAQKTGRYVSYAQPLLDGALPDGSRVNATYSRDVTTRGPTFTIRKFTKEPWTPGHLIDFKTGSPETFAFIWLAIEHKFNMMVVGETGAGKTTFLNSIVSFIPPSARICSIEDTRELNLAHDNWLPSVQRMGFGIPNLAGERYGEVSLFDLLKESFRQNPDYVIVGEVRGKEAYVLFQGMASGHPSFGTFHSGSVENLIRRLQTPPINLSSSLVETLDIVCVTIHEKTPDKNIRRLRVLEEIKEVKPGSTGEVDTNVLFEWNPAKDIIEYKGNSVIFQKILKRSGMAPKLLEQEFRRRTQLLDLMHKKGIMGFKEFNAIINRYYKSPASVLKEFGIK